MHFIWKNLFVLWRGILNSKNFVMVLIAGNKYFFVCYSYQYGIRISLCMNYTFKKATGQILLICFFNVFFYVFLHLGN